MLQMSMSLRSNAHRLVQSRLGRPMTEEESDALDAGMIEALRVLRVGTDEDHQATLQSIALTALSTTAGALLWACLLDEAEQGVQNVSAYAAAVSATASTIVTAQLSSALGLG